MGVLHAYEQQFGEFPKHMTIHYAELSSTAYQRGQVATRSTNVTNLPFV